MKTLFYLLVFTLINTISMLSANAASNYEKCYGISKVGENDGWKGIINPGKYRAAKNYHGYAWEFTRLGTCKKRRGSLSRYNGYNPKTPLSLRAISGPFPPLPLKYEKCYGISKIGKNDGWKKEINPGKYPSNKNYSGFAWEFVKSGSCITRYQGRIYPFVGTNPAARYSN